MKTNPMQKNNSISQSIYTPEQLTPPLPTKKKKKRKEKKIFSVIIYMVFKAELLSRTSASYVYAEQCQILITWITKSKDTRILRYINGR